MNDTGHHATFSQWLKGDVRVDGWKSPWRLDFERRYAEHRGDPKRISSPQPKPHKRTPQPPRYCAVCPNRLNHGNKYGFCQIHLTKNSRRALKIAA